MRNILILLIFALIVSSGRAQDEQPLPENQDTGAALDPIAVKKLVRQLENRERSKRDEAEEKLREMGTPVLSLLPKIDARTGGETKIRLLRIRDHLEKQRVTESATATRFSLKGKMTLSDALDSIKKQTGNEIVDYRARFNQESNDTEIEIDLDDVSFWEGLDKVLDEAGLALNNFVGEPRKLALIAASETAERRQDRGTYSGLFRVEATNLNADRNLRDPGQSVLRMGIEIVWEPRVLPILIQQDLSSLEITTDNDETLAVAGGNQSMIQIPVQPGVAAIDVRLPIDLPTRDAKKIESLKGQFTALVPGGDVMFEFAKLDPKARSVQQSKGGLTVVLDQIRRNGGVQQVSVRLRLDQASDSLQSHLDWVENNVAQLIDPDGKPADEPGLEKYLERGNEVGYSYLFPVDSDLKGWKFVYKTPAGIAQIPVDFELKDITLP